MARPRSDQNATARSPILGKRKEPEEQYDVDDIDCEGMPIASGT